MNGAGISGPPRSGCHFSSFPPQVSRVHSSRSLSDSRSKQSKFVGGDHNLSPPSLSLSGHPTVASPRDKHSAVSLSYLGPFTLTLHGKRRWRRQVATLLSTHATLRNTDVAPISPLSLSHVRRDHHHHRRRRVGLTRPTLNPRLNTKRPLARSSLSRLWGRPAWLFQSLPLVGTGKGRADGAHPISRPAPLAVSQHKM